jgi:alkyl sulfatase BDS1-like metallo-beta-lactamase superfamily hydrolase
MNVTFTDLGATYAVRLRNGVLISRRTDEAPDAALTLALSKQRMIAVLVGDLDSPGIESSGDLSVLQQLLAVLDAGDPSFNIVVP